ncbi:putative LRR receptor-like serine/threonine-protein kinase [Forsythia ovata]|uniref:LRR receptor-like serine/threonine-protein kinase n=1 Tax=Forsythia ovata TaxID=205694 RepID=A0ABD1QLP5_9LAMI
MVALLAIVYVLLIVCRRKTGATNQRGIGVGPVPATRSSSPGASVNISSLGDAFTYKQILEATGEFSDVNLIKNGHSGDFFRGILEDANPIVIKKIDLRSSVKKEAYMLELELFSKVSHPRLVPLLGHCLENENEKFLIYKYMPNGDLSSSLFKKSDADDDSLQSLDWITRLKIAIGAAEGLSFLHHECTPPFVHRDIRASSILLDDKFEVRLGSLSEVCVQEGDTHQNRITRLLRLPQTSDLGSSGMPNATCAYDVYCFGKVLLELVTGKLGISSSTDATMKEWLEATLPYISIYDKELVTNIVDPSLIIDEDLLEEVWAMAIVARSCLNPKPARRPLMRYILKALENPLKVVRDEHMSSARLRTTSSRGSWNAALFGSWRQSSSDVAAMPPVPSQKAERANSFKQSGTTGSQESGQNEEGNGHLSSNRRHSKEIYPEPLNVQDVVRDNED